jgi:hypothetical protein
VDLIFLALQASFIIAFVEHIVFRFVQDDLFGEKHINFEVDGHNYHVLRCVLLNSLTSSVCRDLRPRSFSFCFSFMI